MRTLLASLNDHPIALLRAIAELLGVELSSNVRSEVATQLAAFLSDGEAVRAALGTCTPSAREAWTALLAAGRRMSAARFARLHGEIRPVGPGRLEREAIWHHPEGPAEELWYRGLIFRAFADFGDGPLEYVYIPEDLAVPWELEQLSPAQPTTTLSPVPAPATSIAMQNRLAVDACTALALIRSEPLALGPVGNPLPEQLEKLCGRLLLPDPLRCEFLLALLRAGGWVAAERGRLVVDHQAVAAWLRNGHWQQMTALFRAWRDSTGWNDLRRVPGLLAEGEWRNDPILARRAVLDALHTLSADAWYAIADFIAYLKRTDPDFQRPAGDYSGWYLKDTATGRYLTGFESWEDVEGRLIHFLLTGPLHWLGAVALDAQKNQAQVFRVTRAGTAWLSNTLPDKLPRPERLSVGEDFVVTAPLLCPLLDRYRLLRFTEPLPQASALALATRHRITRSSLTRARASGLKGAAAAEFLRRATGGRLPPKVIGALKRFDRQMGVVHITRGAVLRAPDAAILATLRGDPAIAPLLGDLISAQAVLIPEANLPRLLDIIRDSGYEITLD
ncbi:MAG: helicase-associated domain-containing protein [Anaerolineae bacterium]